MAHADTIYGCLREIAERESETLAVVFEDQRLTYSDLLQRVNAVSRALLASGVGPGDRVAMLSTTRVDYWVVFLATSAIGAIWLGLGVRNRLEEYRYVIGDAEPCILIGIAEFEGRDYRPDLAALKREFECIRTLVVLGRDCADALSFEAFLAGGDAVPVAAVEEAADSVSPDSPALIVYTSGTTGRPKGAMLSHEGLIIGARAQYDWPGPRPVVICSLPVNHIACVGDTCCTNLVSGGTLIFTERFDPRAELELIERERVTVWGGIPTMVQMVFAQPDFDRYDLSSVHVMGWGGAAMSRDLILKMQALCPRVRVVYGLTETSCNTTWTEFGADIDDLASTIGKPAPAFPCRIAREDGSLCGVGETGEIQFLSRTNMLGYWRRPEATREAFTEDGWLRTGDLGHWRANGNIELVGRRSEMFKSGGFNVYPREVELALEEYEGVEVAVVISRPDPLYGEVGHASVLMRADCAVTSDDLRQFLQSRIANYKIPKTIEIVRSLPMLANGKVDRQALRKLAAGTPHGTVQ